jgi:hypothetical protein
MNRGRDGELIRGGVTKIRCQGVWRRHRWQTTGVLKGICKRCGEKWYPIAQTMSKRETSHG